MATKPQVQAQPQPEDPAIVMQDDPATKPAQAKASDAPRNLTRERLQTYLGQRVRAAKKMDKPPKELVNLDPAKRAAEMVA